MSEVVCFTHRETFARLHRPFARDPQRGLTDRDKGLLLIAAIALVPVLIGCAVMLVTA